MDSNYRLQQRLQLLHLKLRNQLSQSSSPISDTQILWQGQFLDGVLEIRLTNDPEIISWFIETADLDCEGMCSFIEPVTSDNVEEIVSRAIDQIKTVYLRIITEGRDESGDTLQ